MSSVAGSAIQGFTSMINTGLTNAANRRATEQTNETNYKIAHEVNELNAALAHEQNDWNYNMWLEENKYNSPKQQVDRLMKAGLSPAAAVQAIEGAGNASALQSADLANQQIPAPQVAPHYDFDFPSILGIMREALQVRKEAAEAEMAETDRDYRPELLLLNSDILRADLERKKLDYQQAYESFPYTLRSLQYKVASDKYLPELQEEEVRKRRAERQMLKMNLKRAKQEFEWVEKLKPVELKKLQAEIDEIFSSKKLKDAQTELVGAQTSEVEASTENIKEQKSGITAESKIKQFEAVLKRYGSPESQAERVGVFVAEDILSPYSYSKALFGLRDYVKYGNQLLWLDPYTRDFLFYYWDDGKKNAAPLGVGTLGGIKEVTDALKGKSGK